jgi:hypothetical protein
MSNAYRNFNQSSLISNKILPDAELMARANQTLDQFKLNTVAEFKRNLAVILSQITTMYTTGYTDVLWNMTPPTGNANLLDLRPVRVQKGNCSCALSDECKEQVVVYNFTGDTTIGPSDVPQYSVRFNIPNMFASCLHVQSLFQSSLEYLFNQTCLDAVRQIIAIEHPYIHLPLKLSALQTNLTKFSPNTPVEEIVNKMMIETWDEKVQYSQYYEECAPKICSYFVTSRNNALYVFTTMIGLFGGLSVALRIIVPLIVGGIRNRMCSRIEPDNMTGKLS